MKKEVILGKPGAPYAKAVKANGFLFVSGNVGVDPKTGKVPEGGIKAQTRQILENLKELVESQGSSLADTVKVNVYLVSVRDFPGMNDVYKEYFGPEPPTRTTVVIHELARREFLIEVDLTTAL
ncbi:RidA family protein [archaeon]|nr:MAG: RidA family protein [archaeon]